MVRRSFCEPCLPCGPMWVLYVDALCRRDSSVAGVDCRSDPRVLLRDQERKAPVVDACRCGHSLPVETVAHEGPTLLPNLKPTACDTPRIFLVSPSVCVWVQYTTVEDFVDSCSATVTLDVTLCPLPCSEFLFVVVGVCLVRPPPPITYRVWG